LATASSVPATARISQKKHPAAQAMAAVEHAQPHG
jgi:hypothetical protein